jgi:hypothetical protein
MNNQAHLPLFVVIVPFVDRHFFEENLILVTPAPILAGLKRFNDRMAGQVGMFGSVLILRVIATAHVPAGLTQAQMNPAIPHLHTFFTAVCTGCHGVDVFNMLAALIHESSTF